MQQLELQKDKDYQRNRDYILNNSAEYTLESLRKFIDPASKEQLIVAWMKRNEIRELRAKRIQ